MADAELTSFIGERLKALRRRSSLSLERVSRLSGVSRGMLSQIERGRSRPTITVLSRIAGAFDLTLVAFLSQGSPTKVDVIRAEVSQELRSADGTFVSRALFPFQGARRTEFYEVRLFWQIHVVQSTQEISMNVVSSRARPAFACIATATLVLFAGSAGAKDVKVTLTGAQETPPVTTSATGAGKISIAKDHTVKGSIKTTGIEGVAAHIHVGAPGQSGPPIITLTKGSDGTWTVPEGSKLTDEQFASFTSGNLYINVHSAEHKPGEIRAQLKP